MGIADHTQTMGKKYCFYILPRDKFPDPRFYESSPEKTTLIFGVLAAFPEPGWGKLRGEIHLDLKALTSQ
jgi:hypothetical protein